MGPADRRTRLSHEPDRGQPIMLTEFGGISFAARTSPGDSWGYSTATTPEDFERRLREVLDAVNGRCSARSCSRQTRFEG
jgi:hypothetical protein